MDLKNDGCQGFFSKTLKFDELKMALPMVFVFIEEL